MKKGILYIVTNDINDKVYIGKTYKSLKERWNQHKKSSKNEELHYKFYNAIRKYGIEHFEIKELGKFEEGILEEKEIEYIEKYDSYKNGYNSTFGGEGSLRFYLSEQEQEDIINLYNSGKSIKFLAKEYNCAKSSISNFLQSKNIEIRGNNESVKMVMYDKKFNIERIFDSKLEILTWLETTKYNNNRRTLYNYTRDAHETGCVRYGHRWQEYNSLVLEDDGEEMLFRTSFEKEKYLEDDSVEIELKDGFYIIPGYLEEKFHIKLKSECPICGKKKSYASNICKKCAEEEREKKKLKLEKLENIVSLFIKNKSNIKIKYIKSDKSKIINIHILLKTKCYKQTKIIHVNKNLLCPICHKPMTRGSNMCLECSRDERAKNIPSKEELQKHLDDGLSLLAISKIYNKTGKSVEKWLKKYNIYTPKQFNYSKPCILVLKDNIEKEFDSFYILYDYLISNQYTNSKKDKVLFKIKNVLDTNKSYLGFKYKSVN